jgi:glycerophosphoryl diester phosphodiesterase
MFDPMGSEPAEEWIELWNAGATAVDLAGYRLGDEETQGGTEGMYAFPAGASLAPGQAIVVANSASAFFEAFGFLPDFELVESRPDIPNLTKDTAWSDGYISLLNSGDDVLLLDRQGQLVDAVSWGSSTWAFSPSVPVVTAEHALERRPSGQDTDSAADWIDQNRPNPGVAGY